MYSWLPHPRFLSAYAIAAQDDPDLAEGTHLRLLPSSAIGLPLAPWQLWTFRAQKHDLSWAWYDRAGQRVEPPDLDAAGGELWGWPLATAETSPLLAVRARFDGGLGELASLDRSGKRVLASQSGQDCLVASPQITRLRVRGRGPLRLLGWSYDALQCLERMIGSAPFASLSAPLEGEHPWYAGGAGPERALKRVEIGAPRRWTPPDRPDGPFDPLPADAETRRIDVLRDDLDQDYKEMAGDPAVLPAVAVRSHEWQAGMTPDGLPIPWQRLHTPLQNALLMKAMDPGVARYLGLMEAFAEPLAYPADNPLLIAAGLFLASPRAGVPDQDRHEEFLVERLLALEPAARTIMVLARGMGLRVRAFATVTAVTSPPHLPAAPSVQAGEAGWERERAGPSTRFRRQLRIVTPPLAPLVALARLEQGIWTTRHQMLAMAPGSDPGARAAAQLLGSSRPLHQDAAGIIMESGLDAASAPWRYRVSLADLFGRFGAPAEIDVHAPPPPPMPEPVLRAHVTPAPTGELEPLEHGSVRLSVTVPSLEDMTAGSRPLARLVLQLNDDAVELDTPQEGGTLEHDFALAPAYPNPVQARAHFIDVDGRQGAPATLPLDIGDPRPPAVVPSGVGIVWTSRPGPSEEVACRLRFGGAPGAGYRAYLADAVALGIAADDGGRLRTRAEIAVEGATLRPAMREQFRLLTDPPLQAGPDGTVEFELRLPRTLTTVQLLRFVPVSARNVEAAFGACPLLPIAVPSDRLPPAPRVEVQVDPATGAASVTVHAAGLDLIALRAAEPGLFGDPPDPAALAPQCRLRRATGPVADPLYAREVARAPLVHADGQFSAELAQPLLTPYLRTFYWAQVRMPPERRLPPGTQEVPLPGGALQPLHLAQLEDAPGAFSLMSAAASAMFVPAQVPDLTAADVATTIEPGAAADTWRLTLTIAGGPSIPHAAGTFVVRMYVRADNAIPVLAADGLPLTDGTLVHAIERPDPVPLLSVALVLIDPLGREAAPLWRDVNRP